MYLGTVLSMYMDGDQNPVCVGVCDNGAGARGGTLRALGLSSETSRQPSILKSPEYTNKIDLSAERC